MKNEFMIRAIQLSKESVNSGGGPFGTVIVKDNKIIAEGSNKVTPTNDPRFGKEKYLSDKVEFTLLKVKWVTRTNPKEDLEQFKRDMLVTTDLKDTGIRIPGILSLKFKTDTLKRVDY